MLEGSRLGMSGARGITQEVIVADEKKIRYTHLLW